MNINNLKKSFAIASDHAGFFLKKILIEHFHNLNFDIVDHGTKKENISVDYPDFVLPVVDNVLCNNIFGILICGSGIGVSIAANRFKKIRAALCHCEKITKLSRQHNNANILIFGSRFIEEKKAINCLNIFLNTDFENGRHQKRIEKIEKLN